LTRSGHVVVTGSRFWRESEILKSSKVFALAAWHSGYRVRLQNRRSRVRIPPGCTEFLHCSSVVIHNLICIVWSWE
jgi:hypothetical protein